MTEYILDCSKPIEDQVSPEEFEHIKQSAFDTMPIIVANHMVHDQLGGDDFDPPEAVLAKWGGTVKDWQEVARYLAGWVASRCVGDEARMIAAIREGIDSDIALITGNDA